MPTYEYRCPDGHEFERFYRKISDAESEPPCPECGKPATRRLTGGAGLVFKGSGFYLTDYGKNAHRGESPSAGKKESGDNSSGESKSSESKSSESKSSESKSSESKQRESSASSDKKASESKSESTAGKAPPKGKSES